MKGHQNGTQRRCFRGHDVFVRMAPFRDSPTLHIHSFSQPCPQRMCHSGRYESALALSFLPPSSFTLSCIPKDSCHCWHQHPQPMSRFHSPPHPRSARGFPVDLPPCQCSPWHIWCGTLLTRNFHFHDCQRP